ncbi:hypothetical protein [Salipaludibacillus sp. CF4.18]|uniref:hypothetical protein n=1 Tax=Salipaludibacillus sp. CF4.18 TaxID=3373081 RepID=UPI003EE64503
MAKNIKLIEKVSRNQIEVISRIVVLSQKIRALISDIGIEDCLESMVIDEVVNNETTTDYFIRKV